MKGKLYLIISISIMLFATVACHKSNEIPATGEPFYRANSLKFFFTDGTNKDLLNLRNNPILPVTFEYTFQAPALPGPADTMRYNYMGMEIKYDTETKMYAWNTGINGKSGIQTHEVYIAVNESDIDTLKAYFSYIMGDVIPNGPYAIVEKLYYNGILITEEKMNSESGIQEFTNKRIFIKKENGATKISFNQYQLK